MDSLLNVAFRREWPVQEKEIIADTYCEYALRSVVGLFSWTDDGYYRGTADGM